MPRLRGACCLSVSVKNSRETIRFIVKGIVLFAQWPDAMIDKLLEDADLRRYADGEHALRAGNPSKSMAIVVAGTFANQHGLHDGNTLIIDYLMPGQSTSYIAVFDGLPAAFDVVARGESEMALIQRKSLLAALALDPNRWADVVLMMCRRLRLEYEMRFLRENSLRCQLAKMLLYWARGQSEKAGGVRIPVAISQDDIAALLGKSPPTISKEIGALIKDGILARNYRQIQIVDLQALQRIVTQEDPGNAERVTALLARPAGILSASD